RGLACAVGADDADLLTPADLHTHRPERERAPSHDGAVETGDDRARPGCGRNSEPQLPLLPRLLDDVEPRQRLRGAACAGGQTFGLVLAEVALGLVVVAR